MEREMLGNLFKYENNMLYKKRKGGKKWTCCNDLKPKDDDYIQVKVNDKKYYLNRLVYYFHHPDWDIYDNSRDIKIKRIIIKANQ